MDLAIGDTLAGVANLWPLGVFFGGVTVLLAGLTRRSAVVGGGAAGALTLMYLTEVLGKLTDAFATVDGLSAFHYYGSAIEDGLDPGATAALTEVEIDLVGVQAGLVELDHGEPRGVVVAALSQE